MMNLKKKALTTLATLVVATLFVNAPAKADHRRYYGGYYRNYPRYYAPYCYRPAYVAPPVVYSRTYVAPVYPAYPPPVYYDPAPVVYSQPVYYSSPVIYPTGFGFTYGNRHRSWGFSVGY